MNSFIKKYIQILYKFKKGVCRLLILNRNQINHFSPKGQVGGANSLWITKFLYSKIIDIIIRLNIIIMVANNV